MFHKEISKSDFGIIAYTTAAVLAQVPQLSTKARSCAAGCRGQSLCHTLMFESPPLPSSSCPPLRRSAARKSISVRHSRPSHLRLLPLPSGAQWATFDLVRHACWSRNSTKEWRMAMSVAGISPAACWNSLIPAPGVLTLDCLTASRDLPGVLDGVLDAIVWNLFLLGVLLIPPSRRPGIPPAAGILSLLASLRVAAHRDAPSQVQAGNVSPRQFNGNLGRSNLTMI